MNQSVRCIYMALDSRSTTVADKEFYNEYVAVAVRITNIRYMTIVYAQLVHLRNVSS